MDYGNLFSWRTGVINSRNSFWVQIRIKRNLLLKISIIVLTTDENFNRRVCIVLAVVTMRELILCQPKLNFTLVLEFLNESKLRRKVLFNIGRKDC